MAGKIQKHKLISLVQSFRDKQTQSIQSDVTSNDEVAQIVRKIWTRSLGYEVDETLPFASFADNITIMKTRDMITKATGKQISLSDIVNANNIAGQIKMLRSQSQEPQAQMKRPKRKARKGPVTPNDVVVFRHKPSAFDGAKVFIESMLAKYRYTWDDVADITPAYDFSTVLNQTGIMDSWSFTIANLTKAKDTGLVRTALCRTLANNPIFSSFFIWNQKAFQTDSALHIIMRQTDEYLNQRIHNHASVKTISEFKAMSEAYPNPKAAVLPGPLFDAYLVPIEETQTVGILMRLHHAIMDASCALIFSDDLEATLGGSSPSEHVDYQIWTDSYYSLRTSLEAQVAINWHVDRLKSAASHRNAFWVHSSTDDARQEGVRASFDVPSILHLRHTHPQISALVILKSAFSLVSTHRSGHTHALFCNHQASREQFPFIPPALSSDLGYDYSAANITGPTIEDVINLVRVDPNEAVLSFLTRMQDEQNNLTKYAAAPIGDIIKGLGEVDGPVVLKTIRNTIFNWVPGLGSQSPDKYDNMEMLAAVVRPDNAFCLNAGLGGEKGCTMIMDLLGPVLSQEEHLAVATEIECVVRWICEEVNWGASVAGFTGVFEW